MVGSVAHVVEFKQAVFQGCHTAGTWSSLGTRLTACGLTVTLWKTGNWSVAAVHVTVRKDMKWRNCSDLQDILGSLKGRHHKRTNEPAV